MKKTLCLFLSVLMLLGALPLAAHGATVVASGKTPTGCDWTLTDDGTLTVTGMGPIGNEDRIRDDGTIYYSLIDSQHYQVKKLIVGEGVTEISENAFY